MVEVDDLTSYMAWGMGRKRKSARSIAVQEYEAAASSMPPLPRRMSSSKEGDVGRRQGAKVILKSLSE